MLRGRTVGRVLLLTGFLLVLFGPSASAGDKGAEDARIVYCLADAHRAELADAAVSLKLADAAAQNDHVVVGGKNMGLDAWRETHEESFDRACKALFSASKDSAGGGSGGGFGWTALLTILLPVAAGAGLTLLTTEFRAARDAGRLRADALRTAARNFAEAVSGYADAWTGHSLGPQPSDEGVARARVELDARLREVEVLHRGWDAIAPPRATISSGPLGESLAEGWQPLGADGRRARAARVRDALDDLHARCETAAGALERPGRPHREMRT